ncbi:hypothetical protein IFR05_005104 [Cadophora sp. M221]|nr:hypothetical protein IFR05_005104 [Cadophora sp. M221]
MYAASELASLTLIRYMAAGGMTAVGIPSPLDTYHIGLHLGTHGACAFYLLLLWPED